MSDQTEEKSGSGILGLGAATVAGVGAGKLMLNRQTNNMIDLTLKGEDPIFDVGGKKEAFFEKLHDVAETKVTAGQDLDLGDKLVNAQDELAKTGEHALSGDAKKAAQLAQKEARIGIKAGMAKEGMPVWRNMTAGKMGKVALVAIPVTIASKLALDAVFGKSHTAKVANDNDNRAAEVAAR